MERMFFGKFYKIKYKFVLDNFNNYTIINDKYFEIQRDYIGIYLLMLHMFFTLV